jgi:hypothetical protein
VAGELVAVSLTEKKTTMVFFCSVPIRCVDRFYDGLGWLWASTRAASWAASVHQVSSSLSSLFYFILCFYILV